METPVTSAHSAHHTAATCLISVHPADFDIPCLPLADKKVRKTGQSSSPVTWYQNVCLIVSPG